MKIIIPIIDHSLIKDAIENNWFETDPKISDDEVSQMAIGIAGEIDDFIRQRDVRELELEKIKKLENDLTLLRDDFSGYAEFVQRNINQSKEISALKQEHFRVVTKIFDEIYKDMKKDFELVNMGDWDKSWIKANILELRNKYEEDTENAQTKG